MGYKVKNITLIRQLCTAIYFVLHRLREKLSVLELDVPKSNLRMAFQELQAQFRHRLASIRLRFVAHYRSVLND